MEYRSSIPVVEYIYIYCIYIYTLYIYNDNIMEDPGPTRRRRSARSAARTALRTLGGARWWAAPWSLQRRCEFLSQLFYNHYNRY